MRRRRASSRSESSATVTAATGSGLDAAGRPALIKGAGDLATGVALRLHRAGSRSS